MKYWVLCETHFKDKENLDSHYSRHVSSDWESYWKDRRDEIIEPMGVAEYDSNADKLSKQSVRTSSYDTDDRYIGFVTKDNRILKFDKLFNEAVVYKCTEDDSTTITYYRVSSVNPRSRYNRLLVKNYLRDIDEYDDEFNT